MYGPLAALRGQHPHAKMRRPSNSMLKKSANGLLISLPGTGNVRPEMKVRRGGGAALLGTRRDPG